MNASLFLQVPQDLFEKKVKDIYIRAITDTFGDIPYSVINDGDVTAWVPVKPPALSIRRAESPAG